MLRVNKLVLHFKNISARQTVNLKDLIVQHRYPVVGARSITTRYGPTVMLTLRTQIGINLQIYLPRRYPICIDSDDIDDIKKRRKKL